MKKHTLSLLRCAAVVLMLAVLVAPPASAQMAQAGGRLVILSQLDGPPLPADLTVLEEYGAAFVLARVTDAQLAALPEASIYDRLLDRTTISLNRWVWDTVQGEPAIRPDLAAAAEDPYFLVQFYGPIREEWKAGLEKLGIQILAYTPKYTYIVRMDPALAERVRASHAVQWVGRYHPAYRLASDEELAHAETNGAMLAVNVSTFATADAGLLQARLAAAGATVTRVQTLDDGAVVVRVWATRDQLPQLAAVPGVFRVEPYVRPALNNDKGVQSSHTWDVWQQGRNGLLQDLMGAGQTVGLVDSGLDNNTTSPTVEDFYSYTGGTTTSRILSNAAGGDCGACGGTCLTTDTDGHGTHTAGSIVGNGYNSLAQRGLTSYATAADPSYDHAWGAGQAPEANLRVLHVAESGGGLCIDASADWNTLYSYATDPARIVSNSWSSAAYTYGGDSRLADYRMWLYQDYLIVVSAGNTGPTSGGAIPQPANAKNIISVGAANNHRPQMGWYADTSGTLVYFSARGPVTTGTSGDIRFKPDIVAPGANVLSTRSNQVAAATDVGWGNEAGLDGGDGDGDNDGRPDYAYMGGTSMSAPQVAGAAAIVRDYFQDIQGLGNSTPPSAALLKAALLNGAVDMGYGYETFTALPSGQVHYGGRNLQGWGYFNVEQAITPRAPRAFFFDDFTNITNSTHQSTMGMNSNGDYVQYTMTVTDSSEPLKITATWTDYATSSSSTYAQNNLDLLVTAPGGAQYRGNHFTGSWSDTTTTAYDTVNNTEAVYLQNPAAGTWTIRVTETDTGVNGTQPFALYVSGGLGVNPAWTRTCSGTAGTCANARGGTSGQTWGGTAVNYLPSLRPVAQAAEHVAPGGSTAATFRLTNGGRSSDAISLSYAVTGKTGAAAGGIAVAFDQASPIGLGAGAGQDVVATVTVDAAAAEGAYDVLVTATSANTGNPQDALVIPLNVIAEHKLANEKRVVDLAGPQVTSDFWAAGSNLWASYLSGESHINDEAEVWASCSSDGGATWTNVGQVDNGDGANYYGPVVAGKADGSSVTFVWLKPNLGVYARTWTRTSGCTGTWRSIQTLASYTGSNTRLSYPDVIYDTDGTILATWRKNDNVSGSGTDGIFSAQSTNDGVSYAAAAGVPNASGTDAAHIQAQLTLDTTNNAVWMAYQNSANNGDIYLKRWAGSSNAWDAAGTNHIAVATTANVEARPGIGFVNGALWVTWHRYADAANPSARLYYARSSGTLPGVTFPTAYQYPVNVRTAEEQPAMVVGDAAKVYITYETVSDELRGANVSALVVPAAGGAPSDTYQLTATVDDPPLYARGNAGSPKLMWATTNVNGLSATGPAVLYSKNPPGNHAPDYAANLGVSQTLYNLEENFDLYLLQLNITPLAVTMAGFTGELVDGRPVLTWETVSEQSNAGFNLYRGASEQGPWVKLNDSLIPSAAPGAVEGQRYRWSDAALPAGTYWYLLEDVDLSGTAGQHGPVAVAIATPNAVTIQGFRAQLDWGALLRELFGSR